MISINTAILAALLYMFGGCCFSASCRRTMPPRNKQEDEAITFLVIIWPVMFLIFVGIYIKAFISGGVEAVKKRYF